LSNEKELIKKIAAKDMQALDEIYRNHYPGVYRFAYMVTQQEATAEDIAQSVFIRVSEYAHQYRAEGSVKAWIIQITRSIALNVVKHNSFCVNVEYDELINIPSDENHFEDIDFLSMLDGLSPMMREIVVLHVVYRFKHYEIAKMLVKSPAAVRQQYKRAMDLLKKSYRKPLYSPTTPQL